MGGSGRHAAAEVLALLASSRCSSLQASTRLLLPLVALDSCRPACPSPARRQHCRLNRGPPLFFHPFLLPQGLRVSEEGLCAPEAPSRALGPLGDFLLGRWQRSVARERAQHALQPPQEVVPS